MLRVFRSGPAGSAVFSYVWLFQAADHGSSIAPWYSSSGRLGMTSDSKPALTTPKDLGCDPVPDVVAVSSAVSKGEASEPGLNSAERAYVLAARQTAFTLYEGKLVAHRSCGIAIAETFGLPTRSYQALRRGGITGEGACGAIRAGEQILGELLGDPAPTGSVTPALRAAVGWYQHAWRRRIMSTQPDIVCNNLVRPLGDFIGLVWVCFCINLVVDVVELIVEALVWFAPSGLRPPVIRISELP